MRSSATFIWNERALFIGPRSHTAVHSHHALEITLALDDDGLDHGIPDGPELRRVAGAVVASNTAHWLSIPGPRVAVLYVDPLTSVGVGLRAWLGSRPLAPLPAPRLDGHQALLGLLDAPQPLVEARVMTDEIIARVVPAPPPARVDSRILAAARFIEHRLLEPPTQALVAAHVGLSASRFGHLFTAQMGLPMRRYILWLRLRTALTAALASGDMTDAAHAAGFADAAHFTRTCRRMFGLAPTAFAPVDAVFVSATPL